MRYANLHSTAGDLLNPDHVERQSFVERHHSVNCDLREVVTMGGHQLGAQSRRRALFKHFSELAEKSRVIDELHVEL